jgi:hypothetical protein
MGECILCGGRTTFWIARGLCRNCGLENARSEVKDGKVKIIFRFPVNSGNTVTLEYKMGDDLSLREFVEKHKQKILYDKENKIKEERGIVQIEFKRKCKECGKVWHSLKSREDKIGKDLKDSECSQGLAGCGMCGGQWSALGASEQTKRNIAASTNELERLRTCPECGSRNYEETEIRIENRE